MRHIIHRFGTPIPQPGTLLVVFTSPEDSSDSTTPLKRLFARGLTDRSFTGLPGEKVVFVTQDMGTVSFYGVSQDATLQDVRDLIHDALQDAEHHHLSQVVCSPLPPLTMASAAYVSQQAVVAAELASYRFDRYRSDRSPPRVTEIHWHSTVLRDADLQQAVAIADAIRTARNLVNEPPNILTPLEMVRRARAIADDQELRVTLRSTGNLVKFGGITAVSRGSKNEPFVMILSYEPDDWTHRVALIGKGITFDSGGLSLKSTEGMLPMKNDMAGAASILALMQTIRQLTPPFAVDAILMLADNKTGSDAIELGSVIWPYGRQASVEINNTDSEGRLLLADGLSYAQLELDADVLIDAATLTIDCMRAFGIYAGGVYSSEAALEQCILGAAKRVDEQLHAIPHIRWVEESLRSTIADTVNKGTIYGGASATAAFLQKFTGGKPWAHIDMAGPVFMRDGRGSIPQGGTGYLVQTLIELIAHPDGLRRYLQSKVKST